MRWDRRLPPRRPRGAVNELRKAAFANAPEREATIEKAQRIDITLTNVRLIRGSNVARAQVSRILKPCYNRWLACSGGR